MNNGLRRQIGTEANRRYLRGLPIFRPDFKLPQRLDELLEEMDKAEKGQERPSRPDR